MNYSAEIRKTYLGAAPHTLYTALVWFGGGIVSDYYSKAMGIVIFILGASLTFPIGELIRKVMRVRNQVSSDNKMEKMFMLSAFTIPLSYPLIYLACQSNINYFFPAFSIIVGAHYLIFIYGYGMLSFGLLSITLVGQGTLAALYFPQNFSIAAYSSSVTLLVFGIIHFIIIKKENYESAN